MEPIKLGDYTGFFRFTTDSDIIYFTYVGEHTRHVHWVEKGKIYTRPRDDEHFLGYYPELIILPISFEEMRGKGIIASSVEEIIQDQHTDRKFWI
jgi:hypothetical protein